MVVAVADFAFEKWNYKQKHRQTKQQVKEEHKEREGSPEVKQKIRAIQRDMATKRMMADIPTADVIVTNPTHISIVIKYDGETMIAPEIIGQRPRPFGDENTRNSQGAWRSHCRERAACASSL